MVGSATAYSMWFEFANTREREFCDSDIKRLHYFFAKALAGPRSAIGRAPDS